MQQYYIRIITDHLVNTIEDEEKLESKIDKLYSMSTEQLKRKVKQLKSKGI